MGACFFISSLINIHSCRIDAERMPALWWATTLHDCIIIADESMCLITTYHDAVIEIMPLL